MSAPPRETTRPLPPDALDAHGRLLPPDSIPLAALLATEEVYRFAESVADLTQMECAVLLYDPQTPRSLLPNRPMQTVCSPICRALRDVREGDCARCERDVHAAAHEALRTAQPVTADCIGGRGTLFACPIVLQADGANHPKAAVVAAATDLFHFDYADRLAEILGQPVTAVQEMLCQTDKRSLNATQLRRVRTIMETQCRAYSEQIAERYAQYRATQTVLDQAEELALAYKALDAEFLAVGRIQRSLVPETPPAFASVAFEAFYKPAQRAGGDYYDFFPIGDGRMGFLIADVSGHGPAAAVVMAMLRAILKTHPLGTVSADELLRYCNTHIHRNIMGDQFVTVILGIVEASGERLTCVSAGHEPPFLYTAAGGGVEALDLDPAFPLGLAQDIELQRHTVAMNPGDALLLYTDGITDAQRSDGERFGRERLAKVFKAHAASGAAEACAAVARAVEEFTDGHPPVDDLTLLVLQRR